MAHPLSREWTSRKIFMVPGQGPQVSDDGIIKLVVDDHGKPDLSKCKKKKNSSDPGVDIDVEIISVDPVHRVKVTLRVAPFTTYVGYHSDLWSGSDKKLIVGRFKNPEVEFRKDSFLNDGQEDGTWTGTHP